VFSGSHIFVEVVLLKKLLVISIFALVALFAVGTAFANTPDVGTDEKTVPAAVDVSPDAAIDNAKALLTTDQGVKTHGVLGAEKMVSPDAAIDNAKALLTTDQGVKTHGVLGAEKMESGSSPSAVYGPAAVDRYVAVVSEDKLKEKTDGKSLLTGLGVDEKLLRGFWILEGFLKDDKKEIGYVKGDLGVLNFEFNAKGTFNGVRVADIGMFKVWNFDKKEVVAFKMVFSDDELKDRTCAIIRKVVFDEDETKAKYEYLGKDDVVGEKAPDGYTYTYIARLGVECKGKFDFAAEDAVVIRDPAFAAAVNTLYPTSKLVDDGSLPARVFQKVLDRRVDIFDKGAELPTGLVHEPYEKFRFVTDSALNNAGIVSTVVQKLPVYEAEKNELVHFFLDVSKFSGKKAGDIKVAKIQPKGLLSEEVEAVAFGVVHALNELADGKAAFFVDDKNAKGFDVKRVVAADEMIDSAKKYYVGIVGEGGNPVVIYSEGSTPDPEKPVEPVTPEIEGLPEGVKPMSNAVAVFDDAAATGLSEDAQKALGDKDKAGQFFVKESLRASIMERDNLTSPAFSAPVFKGEVASGEVGLVMFELTGFTGKKVSDVKALKVLNDAAADAVAFTQVYAAKDLADGTFAVVASDKKTIRAAGDTVAAGDYILFAIKDNGEFDLNADDGVISDPSFAACPTAQPQPSDGSSGGCSVGGFAPAALLLVAPLFLLLKK